ncbi:MAG: M23 family metallopeptidase, partial [Urechidicola sp.]|nr:M23 family metallopeptidase [Urechidicola sp.]
DKKKTSEDEIIAKIKKQERKYKAEIRNKRKEQKTINDKIEQLIKDEITKANLKTGKTSSGFVLTAEAKLIATKFEGNKDKLPWPVERGFISRRFGKQKHPTLEGILIESNGVRITTEHGASARAVFEGTIMQIQSVSGKKAIYIRHGNYITVYNNLETVFVKKGDNVATKQTLGKIYTDKVTNKTVLKFQIWKNATRLNPASWIYKM